MKLVFMGRDIEGKAAQQMFTIKLVKGEQIDLTQMELFYPLTHVVVIDDQLEVPEDELTKLKDKIRREVKQEITEELINALDGTLYLEDFEDVIKEIRDRDE